MHFALFPDFAFTVIVAFPIAIGVTTPFESTFAIFVLLDDHVKVSFALVGYIAFEIVILAPIFVYFDGLIIIFSVFIICFS